MRYDRDVSDFSKGSVQKNILRLAGPMIVAELVNVLYNLVDRMYLGHIPGTGTLSLTGIGLVLPLVTLITAFANLCGTGGAPLSSIARGEKNDGEAAAIQEVSFTLLLVAAAVLMLVLYPAEKSLLLLFGADASTLPYALDYFSIYLAGTPFVMISIGMNPFINAQGFARTGMGTVLLGAVSNILLDPLFIFAFGMGVQGAALATVLSQMFSAVWVMRFLTGKQAVLRLRGLRMDAGRAGRILALGVTGFVFKLTTSATQAIVNSMLHLWGGPLSGLYVGAMTIINSLREVVSQPTSGITGGAQPVMSYNYGARNPGRVCQCIRFILVSTLAYNTAAWLLLQLAPVPLMRIFTDDQELIRLGVPCLRIYFSAFVLMSLQMTGQNTFTSLNRPRAAVFFSLLRKAVLVIPLTILLPRTALGVQGVFWAEAISQLVGATACFATMALTVWKKLKCEAAAQSAGTAGPSVPPPSD